MSDLRVNTISASNGTSPVTLTKQSAAKCWVNYNSAAPSVRDSLNLSSVLDGGSCNYTNNFTSSMGNSDYAPSGFIKDGASNNYVRAYASIAADTFSTSALQIRPAATNATAFTTSFDPSYVCTQIQGDLA